MEYDKDGYSGARLVHCGKKKKKKKHAGQTMTTGWIDPWTDGWMDGWMKVFSL